MWGWRPWVSLKWSTRSAYGKCALVLARQNHDSKRNSSSLKEELRRLYKLIHPDLLHNQPVQQETNQKSFQLLQEYLSAARGGHDGNRFAYHFEFFIPGKGNGGSLQKVSVSLPPPQKSGFRHHGLELRAMARRDMGKLFAACGLTLTLTDSGEDQDQSLPALFQEASELLRQAEAAQLSLQQQVSLISNALYIGKGVRVLFRDPVQGNNLAMQVNVMEKLAKAIDGSPGVSLDGSTFIIGNSYKVDHLGRLWLKADDKIQVWISYLRQVDLITASARRVAAQARQFQEENVAQILGVGVVFADDSLALHQNYSDFLRNVAAGGGANRGVVGGGRFSKLPIRVAEVDLPEVDEVMGCVTIPVTEDFSAVCRILEDYGDEALAHRREVELRERKLEDLRKHVRMKLRLRHLTFDRKVRPDQLTSACTRLSTHAPKLKPFMEGLSLCISDEHRLPSEDTGYYVHMKWNFSLDNL